MSVSEVRHFSNLLTQYIEKIAQVVSPARSAALCRALPANRTWYSPPISFDAGPFMSQTYAIMTRPSAHCALDTTQEHSIS